MQGAIDYFENDGFGVDPWGGRDTVWFEDNATAQEFRGMVIYEPCNYASNVAYYHDATEMCRNAGQLSMSRYTQRDSTRLFLSRNITLGGNFEFIPSGSPRSPSFSRFPTSGSAPHSGTAPTPSWAPSWTIGESQRYLMSFIDP